MLVWVLVCNFDFLFDVVMYFVLVGEVSNMQLFMMFGILDYQLFLLLFVLVKIYYDSNFYGDCVWEQDLGVMFGVYQIQLVFFEDYNLFLDDYGMQYFFLLGFEMD